MEDDVTGKEISKQQITAWKHIIELSCDGKGAYQDQRRKWREAKAEIEAGVVKA